MALRDTVFKILAITIKERVSDYAENILGDR